MKLAEQLAQEIVAEISSSGMKPGDRLQPEVLMAEQRGVSRASLREALRILEIHGLLTIRTGPNGGPVLTELTARDFARMATLHFNAAGVTFRELLDARVVLEPRMAELAAVKHTSEQLLALRSNVREHRRATDLEDLVRYAHYFHELVADMAGTNNRALSLMTASIHGIFDVYLHRGRSVEAMLHTAEVHGEFSDAIEERNAKRAAELMDTICKRALTLSPERIRL
ncbi:GntR family transcriptional regulator [Rhodococcus opacus RKJ300 = JCM 13270]|uniref:GntR family transcriptional regulator n=1 Tax=Rhodococcus opacus RKJ300 = JCM 13270 TaxID=1165867 RepID=I0WZF1_RHOOP|nr:FCD domain-containing protein [Rhodococcus opacus]EID81767.1 GntR family transcriptional regulator [Rhodococcus opacus RKJ300 = JCM 13270]